MCTDKGTGRVLVEISDHLRAYNQSRLNTLNFLPDRISIPR